MTLPPPSTRAFVPFVSVANMMRLVAMRGLPAVLAALADRIEADFRRWPEFDKSPRVAAHHRDGVIELMPTADAAHYAFKYVNGHPVNQRRNLQTVVAFGVLSDMGTGYPILMTEMTLLTALRTAATSGMVARALAPPKARVHALIGNGAQSEFQAIALATLAGLDQLRLWDIDPAAMDKAARNLRAAGLQVTLCASAEDAVQGAGVITTCTADKQNARILTDNMIGAGVHINAIGGDCPGKTEIDPAILSRATVFVEYPEQTRIEGEIQAMPADFPVTELWQVLRGEAPGRRDPQQITLFDGVGFAIEDFSALMWLHTAVAGTDLVEPLDLLADPDDPRDLYGMLTRAGMAYA